MVEVLTIPEVLMKAFSAFTSRVSSFRRKSAGTENIVSQTGKTTNRYQGIKHLIACVAESDKFIKCGKCIDLADYNRRSQCDHHAQGSSHASTYNLFIFVKSVKSVKSPGLSNALLS